ncbi:hypothetical protein F6P83_10335 [Streptococcus suis]|nr:hypothetical protein [Streptococcus suis]MBS7917497.1 hypothetical protein [Streptococcus suis]MBS7976848.1 hypothetical protein [Streptococcus suis]MBS8080483.1 hypothetical protein [Streptococcus suis]MBS8110591.1 hypothetical protein [Streptococcus suis]
MFFYSSVQVNPRILNWGSLHIVYKAKDLPRSLAYGKLVLVNDTRTERKPDGYKVFSSPSYTDHDQ